MIYLKIKYYMKRKKNYYNIKQQKNNKLRGRKNYVFL